jgi:hypothetical protein
MGAQLIERRPPRIPSAGPKGGKERLALLPVLLVAVEVLQDGLAHEGPKKAGKEAQDEPGED